MQKSVASHIVIPPQSPSAIPIVAPPSAEGATVIPAPINSVKPISKGNANAKRLCRNVIIHGYCKFEDKGCEFKHELNKSSPQGSPEKPAKVRIQSPTTRPASTFSSVPADSVNAPIFVPKRTSSSTQISILPVTTAAATPTITQDKTFAAAAATASIGQTPSANNKTFVSQPQSPIAPIANSQESNNKYAPAILTSDSSQFGVSGDVPTSPVQHQHPHQPQSPSEMFASLGMAQPDPYYYMNNAVFTRQPLQLHLYNTVAATTAAMPLSKKLLPSQRTIQSFFIPDKLRDELTRQNESALATGPVPELGLPNEVHTFHSLYPLEGTDRLDQISPFFNLPTSIYKATSGIDGRPYVLCRVKGFQLMNERALVLMEQWRNIQHCNLVSLREIFATQAFDDTSLVFVYDYFPCAQTLYNSYFTPQGLALLQSKQRTGGSMMRVPENTLWSYLIQIASAIRAVHSAGLAVRNIDASKILITSEHRLRIQGIGILDVLSSEAAIKVNEHQQEDFHALGRLIVNLACLSPVAYQDLPQSFEFMSHTAYSDDLRNLVLSLLSKSEDAPKHIDDIITMIGPRILIEMNANQANNDFLENEFRRELDNGRVARNIIKMGFITERPEFDMDPSWSETGDRYIVTLFRDYVFHQVDENGSPVLDMVHVLTCLNKLDAGSDEKIVLMSRDEQSCLIVSYKEVRNCILSAYRTVESKGRQIQPMHF